MIGSVGQYDFRVGKGRHDTWLVWLPHQCGAWDVVPKDWEVSDYMPHDRAVAALELFIAEAQEALAELRAFRTVE